MFCTRERKRAIEEKILPAFPALETSQEGKPALPICLAWVRKLDAHAELGLLFVLVFVDAYHATVDHHALAAVANGQAQNIADREQQGRPEQYPA